MKFWTSVHLHLHQIIVAVPHWFRLHSSLAVPCRFPHGSLLGLSNRLTYRRKLWELSISPWINKYTLAQNKGIFMIQVGLPGSEPLLNSQFHKTAGCGLCLLVALCCPGRLFSPDSDFPGPTHSLIYLIWRLLIFEETICKSAGAEPINWRSSCKTFPHTSCKM